MSKQPTVFTWDGTEITALMELDETDLKTTVTLVFGEDLGGAVYIQYTPESTSLTQHVVSNLNTVLSELFVAKAMDLLDGLDGSNQSDYVRA